MKLNSSWNSMHYRPLVWLLLIVLSCPISFADETASAKQEAMAIEFAETHHPELASLLRQLKEMDAEKFETAILEISRTSDRIERYQERMPERYQNELELWKTDSRIRLLVARSVTDSEKKIRPQLQELLLRRNRLRLQQLTLDKQRTKERLTRLEEQIQDLKRTGEELAKRDADRLLNSATRRSPASQSRRKTAVKDTQSKASQPTAATRKPETKSPQPRTRKEPRKD